MIIATILRNYKCYKNINIVPFSNDSNNSLNIIIGNNGVGKSTILEGLDTLFNDRPWIVNNDARISGDTEVGVFLLLEKNLVNARVDSKDIPYIEKISDYFWNLDFESNTTLRGFEPLKDIREKVTSRSDANYLLLIGKKENDNNIGLMSFGSFIRSIFETRPTNETLSKILEKILALHSYIYIPVETPICDFVRLQNNSLQTLMDKKIKDEIAKALNDRRIKRKNKAHTSSISVLNIINEELESYVLNVENEIKKENQDYSYKPKRHQTTKLTANHVTEAIIDAYYSRRVFKVGDKAIDTLSSGEKRVVLIDLISAFLRKNNPNRELIVAIDEPENSLHISNCYKQFNKINQIALQYKHQLLVTTHWYGALPCLDKGVLIHIDDDRKNNVYNLINYYEERRRLPEDINLKGFFDLSSYILYAYRNNDKTIILVEGSEDKRYIEYYIGKEKANIIPVGGCSIVRKVYEYLFVPMKDQEMIDPTKTKKIICLVDTDTLCPNINLPADVQSGALRLIRLHQKDSEKSTLYKYDNPNKTATVVEDVLEPLLFYNAIKACIESSDDEKINEIFCHYDFNENSKNSRVKGDYGILKPNDASRNIAEDKENIAKFIDDYKDQIAKKYVSFSSTGNKPSWIEELENMIDVGLRECNLNCVKTK